MITVKEILDWAESSSEWCIEIPQTPCSDVEYINIRTAPPRGKGWSGLEFSDNVRRVWVIPGVDNADEVDRIMSQLCHYTGKTRESLESEIKLNGDEE